jgi:hypothetical protein
MEGTATMPSQPNYGANATLQYNTATARTAGTEWPATFTGSGGIIIASTGAITLNAAKILAANNPLIINSGATWTTNNGSRGSYTYHNGTIGTGIGASKIINSGQSIFVQTTAVNPSITFKEADKVTSTPPSVFKKSVLDVLNIDIFIADRAYDGLSIHFDNQFNNDYDNQDFIKLENPEINFYSYLADKTKLASNKLKNYNLETTVPLGLTGFYENGIYTLKFTNQTSFEQADVYLKDNFLNKLYNLKD